MPKPVAALRAKFLYLYQPYDKSLWAKLRSPAHVAVMLVAAAPAWGVRAVYFCVVLLCLLPQLDEYQVMQFVQSLKGMQFVSGILLCLQGLGAFFLCAVVEQRNTCASAGPGATSSVELGVVVLLVYQTLCWAAFALLPRATQYGAASRTSGRDQAAKLRKQNSTHGGGLALAAVARGAKGVVAAAGHKVRGKPAVVSAHEQGYAQLEEQPVVEPPPQPPAPTGGCCGGNRFTDNRMVKLLSWDLGCFCLCTLLFGAMLLLCAARAAAPPVLLAANDDDDPDAAAVDERGTVGAVLAGISVLLDEGSAAWRVDEWQVKVSFFLARLLFALSAAPFLVFEVPLLRNLLSHTSPTGFSRAGGVVCKDDDGLQSYVDWLRAQLATAAAERHLAPSERQALSLAVDEAQVYLDTLPDGAYAQAKRRTDRRKDELEAQLLKRVPRGHALYPAFFAEQLLCDDFQANLKAAGAHVQ